MQLALPLLQVLQQVVGLGQRAAGLQALGVLAEPGGVGVGGGEGVVGGRAAGGGAEQRVPGRRGVRGMGGAGAADARQQGEADVGDKGLEGGVLLVLDAQEDVDLVHDVLDLLEQVALGVDVEQRVLGADVGLAVVLVLGGRQVRVDEELVEGRRLLVRHTTDGAGEELDQVGRPAVRRPRPVEEDSRALVHHEQRQVVGRSDLAVPQVAESPAQRLMHRRRVRPVLAPAPGERGDERVWGPVSGTGLARRRGGAATDSRPGSTATAGPP